MGLFWDLIQQSQIREQREKATSLEERVAQLERELQQTKSLLHLLVVRLEKHFSEDVDGDGRIG
ncbi:MAG: hypothetical protein JSU86_17235 [Phycisphaerales bacterium]|nr:MAG: hypothetical protein JSU86_17235 [Phycisphaerales bacterium]